MARSRGKELDSSRSGEEYMRYMQHVRAVGGMGRSPSNHHVVLCNVRLVGAWIKRREVVVGDRSIRIEKLREDQ